MTIDIKDDKIYLYSKKLIPIDNAGPWFSGFVLHETGFAWGVTKNREAFENNYSLYEYHYLFDDGLLRYSILFKNKHKWEHREQHYETYT
jgi:hypothetical protein